MWDWILELYNGLLDGLYRLYLSIKDVIMDIPLWVVDQILGAVSLILDSVLSLLEPIDLSSYLHVDNSQVAWTLSMIGLPQCLGVISSCILVRILLQLIPFTRLGS